MAVLCLELCGLESSIQLFDMAARRVLEASFEISAVPSGPRAGPSSFTPLPPLWWGRDINVEPGPPGAPDREGPVSRCWERRRQVVSASQVQSTRKNSREEGSGPRPRHASSHETDAPSPGAACPSSALALAVALLGNRIRRHHDAHRGLRSSVLDNKQMSGHGAPMAWPGATSSAPRLWRRTGGAGAGLSRQDTLEAELQAIIEPWRPSKPRVCAATLAFSPARHRDQVASTIPLIPEITNGHRPARKEPVLRR